MKIKHITPAIVIGLDNFTGLQTARILHRRGIPIIALAKDPNHYCCHTNTIQHEDLHPANIDTENLIEVLLELAPTLPNKPVLFPTADSSVLVLSRHRQRLNDLYHLILPAPDVIETMIDKVAFYKFAQRNNLPIPKTFFLKSQGDLDQASKSITYPCILKPPYRTESWNDNIRQKAFVIDSLTDLQTHFNTCRPYANLLILQDLIRGPDTNHTTVNAYFDAKSEPLVTFSSRKLRQWPHHTGQGCLGESYLDAIVIRETVRLFQSVDHHGLGYLEMKIDQPTGQYFIIEPNIGRPTGRSATAEAAGVPLLYTMYCDALDLPLPNNRQQRNSSVKWIYLQRDIQSSISSWRAGELSIRAWIGSIRGPKTFAIFSLHDPVPFFKDLIRIFGRVINKIKS